MDTRPDTIFPTEEAEDFRRLNIHIPGELLLALDRIGEELTEAAASEPRPHHRGKRVWTRTRVAIHLLRWGVRSYEEQRAAQQARPATARARK